MEKTFEIIQIEVLKGMERNYSSLAFFSSDNSFPQFLKEFADQMIGSLKEAMKEKDLTEIKNLRDSFKRFFGTLYNSTSTRLLDYELINFFTNYLLLTNNFLSMIQQGNLYTFYNLNEKEVDDFKYSIGELEDLIKLNLNTENLINLTNDLIKKAQHILGSVPSNFKISDHFFNALKREDNDTCK